MQPLINLWGKSLYGEKVYMGKKFKWKKSFSTPIGTYPKRISGGGKNSIFQNKLNLNKSYWTFENEKKFR